MGGSEFHSPSPTINKLLLTFMCINNGISAFLEEDKNFSSSSDGSISSPVKTVGLGFKCSGAQPKVNIETYKAVEKCMKEIYWEKGK